MRKGLLPQEPSAFSVTRYLIQKIVLTLDFVGRDR